MYKLYTKLLALSCSLALMLAMFSGCGESAEDTASSSDETDTKTISNLSAVLSETTIDAAYTEQDLDGTWDEGNATFVSLSGTYVITSAGVYVFSGTLSDGQIIVEAADDAAVQIVLNGVTITSSESAPIYIINADKVYLTLAAGTENTIMDSANYVLDTSEDEPSAAIFSDCDLTINGSGSLRIEANYEDGIVSKDDLVITGGNLTINAVDDCIRGKDSVAICGGTFVLTAGGDGIKSTEDTDTSKGWVSIDGGNFTITAAFDGIQAETILQISDGKMSLTTGGGSANASTDANGNNVESWGAWNQPDASTTTTDSVVESSDSAKGLKSASQITILGGTITIDASDDAIHANGNVYIIDGTMEASSGDDGVHADAALAIEGGDLTITKSYEGLEGVTIDINSGMIDVTASDDGINSAGGSDTMNESRAGQNSFAAADSYYVSITNGYIYLTAGGDGVDSNGSLSITGGTLLVNGPTDNGNGALDYTTGGSITGGVTAIAGSSGMALNFDNSSTQCSLMINFTSSLSAGTTVTLCDKEGKVVLSYTPTKTFSSIVFSSPDFVKGETYTVYTGGAVLGTDTDTLYTSGNITGGTEYSSVTLSSLITTLGNAGSMTGGMDGGAGSGMDGRDQRGG